MPTKAEKKAAEAAAKREKTEREAQAKREAAEKKAAAAKAKTDNKAKAAADKKAAAQKAATTYNDQGLNAAQQAQIAKLKKQANQPAYQGLGGNNQAAIDRANAEIEKIEAQGKTILDKQYQEKQAPLIEATKQKAITNRAAEAQQMGQQQAAQQQQLQQYQQQYMQEMGQRQDPRQSYANPYFQMTENMPAPVGMSQGPNSQQAQTTMIGAGGNQPQQMSPAQMAQMSQMQGGIMGGMPQGMPPGMGQQQGMPQGIPPQLLAMLQARAQQAQQGQPAPQGQPVRQDMSTFNTAPQQDMGPNHPMYAFGGLLNGYK